MNINCVICSDLINQAENIYFTKCGHVFHHHCLAQWMERSKSCPQCRNKLTEKCIHRIYFNFSNSDAVSEDATTLQSKLDNVNFQLRQKENDMKEKDDKLKVALKNSKHNEELLKATEKKLVSKETAITSLKEQLEYVKIQNRETERLRSENDRLEKSLNTLNGLQKVLNATADEVEIMLQDYADVKTLATFATALKKALVDAESKKNESRNKLQTMKSLIATEKTHVLELQARVRHLEEKLSSATHKIQCLKKKRKMEEENTSLSNDNMANPAKIRKSDSSFSEVSSNVDSPVVARQGSNDLSLNSLVNRIENADSPYLNLKQSSVALSALRHRHPLPTSDGVKPTEFAILNPSRSKGLKSKSLQKLISESKLSGTVVASQHTKRGPTIFQNKQINNSIDLFEDMEVESARHETSYDGLGGHSKLDTFPVPTAKSVLKSCIPKVTAKHRLKRPSPSGSSLDIGTLLKNMSNRPPLM